MDAALHEADSDEKCRLYFDVLKMAHLGSIAWDLI